ncbi:Sec-independent protein translocase protein TatB [Phenylobacterium sp.]|jgi:sec-independent protein translocase protein TatB|uniref:Sec-independent protein translocase protein TatB n=1 Tax=Phenylobacterium sp. TaxID=1871053 RepID=UPI002E3820B0|nr:Sec-independent protein translocase protein TatB [Phenylobacterium sp.]HEX3364560.1 Sec-independent protein translocase protein TatB [Phenylobacterium sp.]
MFPEGRVFEFLIAAVVALIVVGPKDLPVLLRKFGQFMARVRAMAAEFRASFDEMARQSELDELRKEVEAMRLGQLADMSTHAPEMNQTFDEISQGLSDVGVQLNSPAAYPYTPAQTEHVEMTELAKPKRVRKTPAKGAAAKTAPKTKVAAAKSAAPKKAVAAKTPAAKAVPKAAAPKPATKAKPAAPKAAAAKPRTRKAAAS